MRITRKKSDKTILYVEINEDKNVTHILQWSLEEGYLSFQCGPKLKAGMTPTFKW